MKMTVAVSLPVVPSNVKRSGAGNARSSGSEPHPRFPWRTSTRSS
jgi:hypothetical protein